MRNSTSWLTLQKPVIATRDCGSNHACILTPLPKVYPVR